MGFLKNLIIWYTNNPDKLSAEQKQKIFKGCCKALKNNKLNLELWELLETCKTVLSKHQIKEINKLVGPINNSRFTLLQSNQLEITAAEMQLPKYKW